VPVRWYFTVRQNANWRVGNMVIRKNARHSDLNETFRSQRTGEITKLNIKDPICPKQLWEKGIELSKVGLCKDAARNFMLAIFASAALDANDMSAVKVAPGLSR
jgi:hypothetical protein